MSNSKEKLEFSLAHLQSHFGKWARLSNGGETQSQSEQATVEAAIERLYQIHEEDRPAIIWCRSFYQMLTLPSIFIGIMHSDAWQYISDTLSFHTGENDERWLKRWNAVWPEIWLTSGAPLLRGMNATSRIVSDYGHLEGALTSQVKKELGNALRNRRLDSAHGQLRREIYRRFWAKHEAGQNFVTKSLLPWKQDLIGHVEFLQQQHPDWSGWSDFHQEWNRVRDQAHDIFGWLAMRLGGEPSIQWSAALWTVSLIWLSGPDYLSRYVFQDEFEHYQEDLKMWVEIAQGCSSFLPMKGMVFVCQRPSTCDLSRPATLHNETGPALTYDDGLKQYAWHGVIVDRQVIEEPESITVEQIESEVNAEVRRVMIERYGQVRYIQDAGIEPIHTDDYGTLYRKELPGDEPLVMVKVVNSTAEPDGTFRDYFLRVPPDIVTAKEAVAWTFAFDEGEDYNPAVET